MLSVGRDVIPPIEGCAGCHPAPRHLYVATTKHPNKNAEACASAFLSGCYGHSFSKLAFSYSCACEPVTMILIHLVFGLSPLPTIHSREMVLEPASVNFMFFIAL